ncbi:MAG: CPBP family intramembrane metalloprotease, partial [Bacteroidia bacterium]|nr:CPBP family intramembrane metalloprotease [Bacteroidia bacterium]
MQNYDIQHKQPLGIHQGSFYNPWGLAFVLIFLFLFQLVFYFLALFTAGLYYNLPIADVQNILSEPDGTALAINIARYTNIVSFTGYMFLPALLFGIINRTGLLVEGGLKIKPKSQLVFLSVLIVGLCIPLVEYLTQVMHHIQWPQSVQFLAEKFNNARTEQINTILDMHSLPELILCILAIGLLPALFEEMMFRGILLNIFKNIAIRKWTPIVLQALVFTVLHFSFYEFPGIFMMGIIFGIIAYKTGTIWYG